MTLGPAFEAKLHRFPVGAVQLVPGNQRELRLQNLGTCLEARNRGGLPDDETILGEGEVWVGRSSDCLGAHLARIEGRVAIGTLVRRFPGLALAGDPLSVGPYAALTSAVSERDSVGLAQVISSLNEGRLAAGEALTAPTGFLILGAANPFRDTVERLEEKVAAGVACFQTNVVFDVERFEEWFEPVVADVSAGILVVFALASLSVYGITIAGWSSANKYSMFGAIRASAQMISYEVAIGLTIVGALLVGAHFDHLGETEDGLVLGADDNAAAVAVLLAAAPAAAARGRDHGPGIPLRGRCGAAGARPCSATP